MRLFNYYYLSTHVILRLRHWSVSICCPLFRSASVIPLPDSSVPFCPCSPEPLSAWNSEKHFWNEAIATIVCSGASQAGIPEIMTTGNGRIWWGFDHTNVLARYLCSRKVSVLRRVWRLSFLFSLTQPHVLEFLRWKVLALFGRIVQNLC